MSGTFSFSVLLHLSAAQRTRLEHLAREHGGDPGVVISAVLAEYLDALPDAAAAPPPDPDTRAEELRARRAELLRLEARHATAGSAAPAWLGDYIAQLRAEVAQLEQ